MKKKVKIKAKKDSFKIYVDGKLLKQGLGRHFMISGETIKWVRPPNGVDKIGELL